MGFCFACGKGLGLIVERSLCLPVERACVCLVERAWVRLVEKGFMFALLERALGSRC